MSRLDWKLAAVGGAALGAGFGGFLAVEAGDAEPDPSNVQLQSADRKVRSLSSPVSIPASPARRDSAARQVDRAGNNAAKKAERPAAPARAARSASPSSPASPARPASAKSQASPTSPASPAAPASPASPVPAPPPPDSPASPSSPVSPSSPDSGSSPDS